MLTIDPKITTVFYALMSILAVSFILTILLKKQYRRVSKLHLNTRESLIARYLRDAFIATFVAAFILSALFAITYKIALNHGLYDNKISISDMVSGIINSPKEDALPEDVSGAIIVYYKFGCPACEVVCADLKSATNKKENIYWVSTRSEQGKALLKKYPIEKVPSGIYIKRNESGDGANYIQKLLYEKKDDTVILATENLERLLLLQSENR